MQKHNCGKKSFRTGLLEGKCVCRGYAEIIRNACSLVGIKALCVGGDISIPIGGMSHDIGHMWNKIQIDGEWYNFDATNDHDQFIKGEEPKYAFKRDLDFREYGYKEDELMAGPECTAIYGEEKSSQKPARKPARKSNGIISRLKSFIASFKRQDKPLALPENTESAVEPKKPTKSWDLSNWGIDKEQFIAENAKHMEEYTETIQTTETRETTEIEQEEGFTMHSGHEGGFERE